jgi:hypothetical protein
MGVLRKSSRARVTFGAWEWRPDEPLTRHRPNPTSIDPTSQGQDQTADQTHPDATERFAEVMIEELRDRVRYLERQVEEEREARRRLQSSVESNR